MRGQARQFAPDPVLAQGIDAFWIHASAPGADGAPSRDPSPAVPPRVVRVAPDGCIDLIFRARRHSARNAPPDTELFVAGATTRAHEVEVEPGTSFVGVRFRPGMSRLVIDADPDAFAGRNILATDLDPALAPLADRLSTEAAGPWAALCILRREVQQAADASRRGRPPGRVREALRLLGGPGGDMRVDDVARAVGINPRSLHRDVVAWTGLAPKLLARILRFQAALRRIGSLPALPYARIAQEVGYADQAHMAREFRALAGAAPSKLQHGIWA